MKQDIKNIKEQLEEVIKKEKLESELAIFWDKIASYLPKSIERSSLGDDKIFTAFKQAYIEFRPLIADEVLKVVKQSLKDGLLKRMMKYDSKDGYSVLHDEIIEKVYEDVEDLLSSLSPNKENKNNG